MVHSINKYWTVPPLSVLTDGKNTRRLDLGMMSFVTENHENFKSELDNPITQAEVVEEISKLENNKAVSFDRISNEILKAGKHTIENL